MRPTNRRESGRVARACLRDALTPGLAPDAWNELDAPTATVLTDLAIAHGVEGWVRRRAESRGIALPTVTDSVHAALARHQRAISDLQLVNDAMTSIDRDFLVVKGPALVEQFYPDRPELRSSVDLDILVRADDVREALEALERAGCTLLDANWPLLTRLRVHELRVESPSGGMIDLHWSLQPQSKSAAHSTGAAALIARSRQLRIAAIQVRTLDWADTVVHLAVHAADSGADRLIWYCDLRGALEKTPTAGEPLVVQRAAEWRAMPALQLLLIRARRAIDLNPSVALLDQLGERGSGRGWSGLVRAVDLLAPVGTAPGRPSVGRIIARSARGDALASWRALATKSLRAALPGRRLDAEQLRNPWNPGSGLYPSGGQAGRETFLRQLATSP